MGYDSEDVIGNSFRNFFHPEDLSRLNNFIEEIKNTRKRFGIKLYRLKHKNGTWRYYTSNETPLLNKLGRVVGYVMTARNIMKVIDLTDEIIR